MANKRKHVTLSLEDKCSILDRIEKGESAAQLAREFNVGKSTISDIKRNSKKIKDFVASTEQGPSNRQTLKISHFPLIDQAVYAWFLQQRSRNMPISGELLREKAKFFQEKIYPNLMDKFKASEGWLSKFKKRHGIRYLSVTTEKWIYGDIKNEFEHQTKEDDILLNDLNNSNNEEEEKETFEKSLIKHEEAVVAFNKCIEWAEENQTTHNQVL